ncbi:LPD16 domain-containing protein [Clostridium sp. C45]|uniref:LPD16 domain-containing protein n=1 Tax=Clostridium sp. 10cd* TaxID=3373596 RepID=UPI0037C05D64
MSKEIRFINSNYDDLFRIVDGSTIQIEFPKETIIKACKYVDDYHTKVGNELFHICQFAEMMERVGAKYTPEVEPDDFQVAYKVGRNHYLALQTSDEGYDYTLYDKNFNEIDGGQLDDPELSMIEARKDILSDFKLGNKDLVVADYDDLLEKVEEVETKAVSSVLEKLNIHKQAILENKHSDLPLFDDER